MLQQIGTLILTAITSVTLFVSAALLPKQNTQLQTSAADTPLPIFSPLPSLSPSPTPTSTPSPTPRPRPKMNFKEGNSILENINVYRSSKGLNQLARHGGLCSYAQSRAVQIQSNWSHGQFNADITNGTLGGACSDCIRYGENLGKGFADSSGAVQGWLGSSGHRANIEGSWDFGCGVLTTNGYAVIIFGKKK